MVRLDWYCLKNASQDLLGILRTAWALGFTSLVLRRIIICLLV